MALGGELILALLLAVPVACVVWTVTQEELFREMREALEAAQRQHRNSLWRRKLAYLPTCPYCFSHYVAALFLALFDFRLLTDDWRGYLVGWFTLVLVANLYLTGYHLLRVTLRRRKALADLAEARLRLAKEALAAKSAALALPAPRPRKSPDRGRTVRFPETAASR